MKTVVFYGIMLYIVVLRGIMMDIKKLDSWAEQLLDTGKRNNLVNFKDTKSSSVEVFLPEISSIFEKADSSASFEVFDPKLDTDEDDIEDSVQLTIEDNDFVSGSKRSEYIAHILLRLEKLLRFFFTMLLVIPLLH